MPIIILDEEEELASTTPVVTQHAFPKTVTGCNAAIALIEQFRDGLATDS
jgi:hypothetical protein